MVSHGCLLHEKKKKSPEPHNRKAFELNSKTQVLKSIVEQSFERVNVAAELGYDMTQKTEVKSEIRNRQKLQSRQLQGTKGQEL